MRILLIGKNGQVGWELQRSLSLLGELIAIDRFDTKYCGNLERLEGIAETIRRISPDIVVNAAAYTAVDKAENEKKLALRLNAESVEVMAKETAKLEALLIHYSTDYVFNGSGTQFRTEDENTGPLNIYGETKLAGEISIEKYNPRHFIFRTSWVYAARGANFAKTILRLAREREFLSIINDQHGAPTGAELLADCTAIAIRTEMVNKQLYGTYHLVASGETTWFEYAQFVLQTAQQLGEDFLLKDLKGVSTSAYPTAAVRPENSRLSNNKFQRAFNVAIPEWKIGVKRAVMEMLSK